MRNSLLYSFLHTYGRLCIKLYFKKIEIHGLANIPKNGPVIIAANHQNAFLDAILVHLVQPRHPHFLTRGDVFNKAVPNLILRSLKMRPIFRFRDGISSVKRNAKTFDECFELLETGKAIGIFPEGNHDLKFNLRPLQKGCARIVYDTESRNDFKLNTAVIPMGIQYYGNQHSRSKVLIQVGEPIWSSDFTEFSDDEKTYHQALTERIKAKLSPLILDIPNENYDRIKRRWLMLRQEQASLLESFREDKKIIDGGLPEDKPQSKTQKYLKWSLLPIAIYGTLNHMVIYPLLKWLSNTLSREKEFLGSIKMSLSIFLIPILYALQTALLYDLLGEWAGLYLISLPLSGMVFKDFLAPYTNKIWATA